jgi:hypothetical protein
MRFFILLILINLFHDSSGTASLLEEPDSTERTTPFRQGRWMASISGYINSSNTELSGNNGTSDNFSNNFFYYLSGSYFLKDRFSLGLYAGFNRSSSEELIIRESEGFIIGPRLRYYLSKNKEGSLYLLGGLFYARFYDRTALLNIPDPVDNILLGRGIGMSIGLGYSYVFKDLLILEIGFSSNFSGLEGKTTNRITKTVTNQDYTNHQLSFQFGFGIMLGKGKIK